MAKRFLRAAVLVGALICSGFTMNQSAHAQNLGPCLVVRAPVAYDPVLKPARAVRGLVEKYRRGWRSLCRGGNGMTLGSLLDLGQRISRAFKKLIDQKLKPSNAPYEKINTLLSKRYPQFVPAFFGMVFEGRNVFEPDLKVFANNRKFGNAEDRRFFNAWSKYFKDLGRYSPWQEGLSETAACVKFDRYPWQGAIKAIFTLSVRSKSSGYRRYVAGIAKRLREDVDYYGRWGNRKYGFSVAKWLCSCGRTANIVPTLKKISDASRWRKPLASIPSSVRRAIRNINAGKTKLHSQKTCPIPG